jgi:predicted AlkP superfamily pyrophosphatase or phosphodiesterase
MTHRTFFFIAFFLIFTGLISSFGMKEQPAPTPASVVLIGWDGADRRVVQKLMARGKLPQLRRISKSGSLVNIDVQGETDTRAGWAEILTGCEPSVTGVYSNVRYNDLPCDHTIFERLKYHFGSLGIATGAFIAKQGYVLTGPSPLNAIDEYKEGLLRDSAVAAEAVSFISRHQGKRFFLFVHFDGPDKQGHGFGEFSREYRTAIREADRLTGRILSRLHASDIFEKTAVYVTADHGFDKGKTTHKNAPEVFLASSDPMLIANGTRSDITPTILHRMGLSMNEITPQVSGISLSSKKPEPWKKTGRRRPVNTLGPESSSAKSGS